jgi:hypothetical protein
MFVLPLQSNRILQGVLLPTLRPYGTEKTFKLTEAHLCKGEAFYPA